MIHLHICLVFYICVPTKISVLFQCMQSSAIISVTNFLALMRYMKHALVVAINLIHANAFHNVYVWIYGQNWVIALVHGHTYHRTYLCLISWIHLRCGLVKSLRNVKLWNLSTFGGANRTVFDEYPLSFWSSFMKKKQIDRILFGKLIKNCTPQYVHNLVCGV